MRQAMNSGLLKAEDGALIGINLGAGYCAEHEWGIKELRRVFGMTEDGYGLAKRTIRQIPTCKDYDTREERSYVTFLATKKMSTLVCSPYMTAKVDNKNPELSSYNYKDQMNVAWDEESFGIIAFSKEDKEAVKEIYDAIQKKDLAIWLGGGGVFQNAGLVLAIVSRIPKENADTLRDADIDKERLLKAAKETGIEGLLKKVGKQWFALSPKWTTAIHTADGRNIEDTKYPVMFWLNPMEQQKYNAGWFTVENLELWAEDKGPVIKTKEKKNAK